MTFGTPRPALVIAFAAVLGLALWSAVSVVSGHDPICSLLPQNPDTPALTSSETQQLLEETQAVYAQYRQGLTHTGTGTPLPHFPQPLSVSDVSKTSATLHVADAIGGDNLAYAQAWQSVYNDNHGSNCDQRAVQLRVVWPSGSVTQTFRGQGKNS